MGLFDKKTCDICGDSIGLLGNRKLEDGNMCKNCAARLSPFMTNRRRTTIAEIKEHLAYRDANKDAVAAFNVTRTLGNNTKVLLDEDNHKFIVTSASKWRDSNPDVMDYAMATGCYTEIKENQTEIKRTNADGKTESYNPKRYKTDYNFHTTIHINSPWFDEINFKINTNTIEQRGSVEFKEAERTSEEIREALTSVRQEVRDAQAPKMAQTCPKCGASTIPDASGCCEYCGTALSAT